MEENFGKVHRAEFGGIVSQGVYPDNGSRRFSEKPPSHTRVGLK